MKYKKNSSSNKKRGFTIIESLVYIFLTTLILMEGISLFTSMYKSYMDSRNVSIKYNNLRNFYINIDNILSKGSIEEITVENNRLFISKDPNVEYKYDYQIINSYDGNIVVKYTTKDPNKKIENTINIMLTDIDKLNINKKGKLIYLTIANKDGRKFIRCI